MKFTQKFGALFVIALLVLSVTPSQAVPHNWTGANSSNWFDPGNWDAGTVPGPGDNTRIGTSLTAPTGLARINTGAPAFANNLVLGDTAADSGTLFINGGSTLTTSNDFRVGDGGAGAFTARDTTNTQVNGDMFIGMMATSTGSVSLNNNSSLDILFDLIIGNRGVGSLDAHDNSVIGTVPLFEPTAIILGNFAGSTGTASFADFSVATTVGDLIVGFDGSGTLTITDSAQVTANGTVFIGLTPGSTGLVDVSGNLILTPFFNLTSGGDTVVGEGGDGTLNIHDGGNVLTNGSAFIGDGVGSTGTATVTNADSLWAIAGDLFVGNFGTGSLTISDTAEVFMSGPGDVNIGANVGSVGTLTVDNGLLDPANIWVGGTAAGPGGAGTLNIINGGVVTATGDVTVWNTGTLSVDPTYTLNVGGILNFVGGTLVLADGTNFINPATLTDLAGPDQNGMRAFVDAGDRATISGDLSGNGDLVKIGAGSLVLDEVGFYDDTRINDGTLEIANPSAFGFGNTVVNTGGTLRTVEGAPLQYFMFGGDLIVNGGTFLAQVGGVGAGEHDQLSNAGNIFLDPNISHLFVHRINGYNPNNGDVVTIIDGTSLTGQFSDAPQAFIAPAPNDFVGLIQPFADYDNIDPNSVDLVFGFANTFLSQAKTPNQQAVAAALDKAVAAGCIVTATNVLGNIPLGDLRPAYDLIAPEELASIYEASFAQGMVTSTNLQRRMDDIRWGSTGFCADGFVLQDNHGYTKNDGKSVNDKNMVEQTAPPNYRWGAFITGTGELTKVGDEGENANGYQLNNAGFTMGVDYRLGDHFAIGLSGGYNHTTAELVENGRLNTDGGRMGLYATYYTGGFYVDASASGGWNQYDTRRSAFLGQDTGSTDGAEFNGMVAAGYDWKQGCWTFGPVASFEYDYVEFNSFSEDDRLSSASLIPLHYPDQNQEAYRSNLGFRIAHEQVMKPGEGLTVVPELRAAWRHDFGPQEYAIDANFIGCTDLFTVHGPYVGRDSAVVNIGLTAYCTPGLSAYVFYDGQFGRDNYNNNAISGGFRVAF
jgi:outer membrane autotransporter protein